MFDVAIIGGGVVGSLTARALMKYRLSLCLIEKNNDVASETSKANSAIVHAGFDAVHGTSKARFNVEGNRLMEETCRELAVPFKRIGSLVLAFGEEQEKQLDELFERGAQNGVEGLVRLTGDEARALEPKLSDQVSEALLAQTGGIVCPFKLTQRACQNAVENGMTLFRNTEVKAIAKEADGFVIQTNGEAITARVIINAAGVYADEIARMAGDDSFRIVPRKGEYMLYDKTMGDTVSHTIFQLPTKHSKGILITPTVDGNLLVGPTATDIEEKGNVETTEEGLHEVLEKARLSIPSLDTKDVITSFAGLRAVASTEDFILGESAKVKGLIHAAGMQSPGLSASPAVAAYLAEEVYRLSDGAFPVNPDYDPAIKPPVVIAEMSPDELHALIKDHPYYGKMICRCETVSEGEIADAIRCGCGANDIDGVKRRVRAGAGRCQGGFCMPRVLEILSAEKGVPFTDVTKNGGGSAILTHEKGGDPA